MRLRVQSASPFCRKVLAVLRLRGDRPTLLDAPLCRDLRSIVGAAPLLETPSGARVGPAEIVTFLEDRRAVLLPAPLRDRALDLDALVDLYLLEAVVTVLAEPDTPAAARARDTADRMLALLEDRLDGGPWLLGRRITLPDVSAFVGCTDLQRLGVSLPPRVRAHVARCRRIPALDRVADEADALFGVLAAPLEEVLPLAA
jgi:glutathione S-transferase